MADYQAQLTSIYNKLSDIDSTLAKLALKSYVNTIQATMTSSLNTLTGQVNTITAEVEALKLTVADLLTELRSK
jgi:conjugal transfer/entry exclusion protein